MAHRLLKLIPSYLVVLLFYTRIYFVKLGMLRQIFLRNKLLVFVHKENLLFQEAYVHIEEVFEA